MVCLLSGTDFRDSLRLHFEEGTPDKIADRYFPLAPDKHRAFLDSYLNTLTLLGNAASR